MLVNPCASTDQKVDVVMESDNGEIVGLEVKANASVSANDFKGLRSMEHIVGSKFRRGIVFYA